MATRSLNHPGGDQPLLALAAELQTGNEEILGSLGAEIARSCKARACKAATPVRIAPALLLLSRLGLEVVMEAGSRPPVPPSLVEDLLSGLGGEVMRQLILVRAPDPSSVATPQPVLPESSPESGKEPIE